MQSYLQVRWLHTRPDQPTELWSELDGERFEVRKIEIFPDGKVGYADADTATLDTQLGKVPLPALHEFAANPEFEAHAVSREEFERLWQRR